MCHYRHDMNVAEYVCKQVKFQRDGKLDRFAARPWMDCYTSAMTSTY